MPLISIIVPCYNVKDTLVLFVEEVKRMGKTFVDDEIELIFVDAGSTDGTLEEMRRLCAERAGMRYISFSRNFGKEAAMLAGLKASTGEYVAVMDADLQDQPSLLPEMLKAVKDGYDCIGTRRVTRKGEPPIRSLCSRRFYKFINSISDTLIVDGWRDFKLMRQSVADAK